MRENKNKVFADEIEVKICKRKFNLKGTFGGMKEMENRACCGISALAQRILLNMAGINDITAIIYGGIIGKLPSDIEPIIDYDELGELILKHGMADLIDPCRELITFGMTGKMSDEFDKPKKKLFRRN